MRPQFLTDARKQEKSLLLCVIIRQTERNWPTSRLITNAYKSLQVKGSWLDKWPSQQNRYTVENISIHTLPQPYIVDGQQFPGHLIAHLLPKLARSSPVWKRVQGRRRDRKNLESTTIIPISSLSFLCLPISVVQGSRQAATLTRWIRLCPLIAVDWDWCATLEARAEPPKI